MSKAHYRESPTESQKKSFKPYLSEDEELILVTGLGKAYLRSKFAVYLIFPGLLFGAALAGLVIILGGTREMALTIGVLVMVTVAFLRMAHLSRANKYLLTTRRVIIKKGVFSVKLTATLFDKITHLEVDQSFLDRILLHHGTIIINTAGLNKNDIVLKFVDYPMELKNLLERLINRERDGSKFSSLSTVEGEILD